MQGSSKVFLSILIAVFTTTVGAAGTSDANETPLTAQQQAIADRLDDVVKGYLNSSDIALRTLYSTHLYFEPPNDAFRVREDIPIATLLEQAHGSTDPLVLDALLGQCGRVPGCDRVDLATRWTQADTQNQVAWLMLASARKQRGDLVGARETFVRAAQASSWHGHYGDAVRRGAYALPPGLLPPERAAALSLVYAKAGLVIPFEAVQTLGDFCKEPGTSRQACARIVDTMVRDSDDLFALTVAAPYAARAGVSRQVLAGYQQKSDAIHWGLISMSKSFNSSGIDVEDSAEIAATLQRLEARIGPGERGSAERNLLEQHLTDAEAATRYAATLNEWTKKNRAEVLLRGS